MGGDAETSPVDGRPKEYHQRYAGSSEMTEKENDDLTYAIQYVCWLLSHTEGDRRMLRSLDFLIYQDLDKYLRKAWKILQVRCMEMACQSQKQIA